LQIEETELVAAGSVGLAEDTGGFAVRDTNDLAAGAARVAEESRTYYLLGYSPPEGKGPRGLRKLKVEVKRPELKVRARKGYTLRSPAEIAAAAEPRPPPTPGKARLARTRPASSSWARVPADVARARPVRTTWMAIPLRAMAYGARRPARGNRAHHPGRGGRHETAWPNLGGEERPRIVLSFSISATHRDSGGRSTSINASSWTEAFAEPSKAGSRSAGSSTYPRAWPGRVVVRDEFLGRVGALTVRFVVPAAAGLRISTPILTDRLMPMGSTAAAQPSCSLVASPGWPPLLPVQISGLSIFFLLFNLQIYLQFQYSLSSLHFLPLYNNKSSSLFHSINLKTSPLSLTSPSSIFHPLILSPTQFPSTPSFLHLHSSISSLLSHHSKINPQHSPNPQHQ
jgi:hypothetical protein